MKIKLLRSQWVLFLFKWTQTFSLDGSQQITPAHDPNDFEVGKCHNIEFINIFTDDGKINSNGGSEFEGMPRFRARAALIEALKNKVWLLANICYITSLVS